MGDDRARGFPLPAALLALSHHALDECAVHAPVLGEFVLEAHAWRDRTRLEIAAVTEVAPHATAPRERRRRRSASRPSTTVTIGEFQEGLEDGRCGLSAAGWPLRVASCEWSHVRPTPRVLEAPSVKRGCTEKAASCEPRAAEEVASFRDSKLAARNSKLETARAARPQRTESWSCTLFTPLVFPALVMMAWRS